VLAVTVILALALEGCHREKIHPEPTDEGAISIESTVRMGDPRAAFQLVKGFHQIEQNAWRWTMGRFMVTLHPPEGAVEKGAQLVVEFACPEAAFAKTGPTTLTAGLSGKPLGSATCTQPGAQTLRADVPPDALRAEAVTFDFSVSKFIQPGSLDGRELGVIARSIGIQLPTVGTPR